MPLKQAEQSAIAAYIAQHGVTICIAGATTKQLHVTNLPSRAATKRDMRDLYGDAYKPYHAINHARPIKRANLINQQRQARKQRG